MKKNKIDHIITTISKLVLFILVVVAGISSCKKDKADVMPSVTNFRVVEKDSAISGGAFGLYIAIQGDNLQNVQEVWFNDIKAILNPNFVTSNNIICVVPSTLPGELLNQVKLVTGSGLVYTTDFKVILPKPVIKGLYNERAAPGSTTKVLGDYLFFISSVKIGDQSAQILDQKEHEITIKIPDNALAGSQITVIGDGGTAVSTFKYNDEGIWLFDFDKAATSWGSIACWGGMKMRSDAESLVNAYGYVEGSDLPPSGWNNDWVTSTCWFDYGLNDVDFKGKILKFEVNAKEPWVWSDALSAADHAELLITINGSKTYEFRPEEWAQYKTSGFYTDGWMTVSVPMSAFNIEVASINDFQLVFKTNKQSYSKFATYFDNFRICTPQTAQ
jgi:hypothetical protein